MHMYLYTPHEAVGHDLLSPILLDLTSLWHRGFLNSDSTVWVNAARDATRFWALTEESKFVLVIPHATPGFVRVTKSSIRWARTFDGSVDNPVIFQDLSELPGGTKTNVTVIAKHTNLDRPISVIDGGSGKTVPLEQDGTAKVGNATVVDWPRFVPHTLGIPNKYESVNAELHGIEFLCSTVDSSLGDLIRKHMQDYCVELKDHDFNQINVMLDLIDNYSDDLIKHIYSKHGPRSSIAGDGRSDKPASSPKKSNKVSA